MFDLIILAQDGKMQPLEITSITLPTSDGQRTILSRHMEAYVEVDIGIVEIKIEKSKERYAVGGGLFHFKDNQAALIVSSFEREDEVDFERARKAYERAKNELQNKEDRHEMLKAEQALKRALARLNLEK